MNKNYPINEDLKSVGLYAKKSASETELDFFDIDSNIFRGSIPGSKLRKVVGLTPEEILTILEKKI